MARRPPPGDVASRGPKSTVLWATAAYSHHLPAEPPRCRHCCRAGLKTFGAAHSGASAEPEHRLVTLSGAQRNAGHRYNTRSSPHSGDSPSRSHTRNRCGEAAEEDNGGGGGPLARGLSANAVRVRKRMFLSSILSTPQLAPMAQPFQLRAGDGRPALLTSHTQKIHYY